MTKTKIKQILHILPVSLGGVVFGHAFVYRLLFPDPGHRHDVLHQTGHGHLPFLTAVGVVLFLLTIFLCIKRGLGRKANNLQHSGPTFQATTVALFLVQAAFFVALEFTERIFSGGLAEAGVLLGSPLLACGVVLQLVTATLVSLMVCGAERISYLLARYRPKTDQLYKQIEAYQSVALTFVARVSEIRAPPLISSTWLIKKEAFMKKFIFAALLAVTLIIPAGTASAHVRLDPSTATVGRQTYYVRVPNEKDIPTTSLRLVVPENVTVTGVLSNSDWKHSEKIVPIENAENDDDHGQDHGHGAATHRITEITWSEGQINPGEYMLFGMATNYEGDPGKLIWKAYQTYSDGTVVPWDDSSDAAPAPTVNIANETQLDTLVNSVEQLSQSQNDTGNKGFKPDVNTWLAGAAFVLGLASLVLVVRKRQ